MARRTPSSRPTHCPACDARLDADVARQPSPSCPACGQSLEPVRVASFWRRVGATAVDGAMLLVTAGLLNWALLRLLGLPPLTGESTGIDKLLRIAELEPTAVAARVAPFLTMAALYVGLFWVLTGRTIGQRLLRIRVVDAHGRPPSIMWVTVRIVGMGLGLLAGGLGWLWAAFDLEKRAWHDHLAGTYVVMDNTVPLATTPKARADSSRNGGSSSNATGRAAKADHLAGTYVVMDDSVARPHVVMDSRSTPTTRSSGGTIDSPAPTS